MTMDEGTMLVQVSWKACAKNDYVALGLITAAVLSHIKRPDPDLLRLEIGLVIDESLLRYKLGLTFNDDGTVTQAVAA